MIVTDKLVFLQLQKTACTHIARILTESFAGRQLNGKHRPLPRGYHPGSRLIVGSVRNPWDWYVSLWAFGCRRGGGPYRRCTGRRSIWKALRDPRARQVTGHAWNLGDRIRLAQSEWGRPVDEWRRLHADPADPVLFRGWLKLVLDSCRGHDLYHDYGLSAIGRYAGLLTYLHEFLYLRDNQVLFRRNRFSGIRDLIQHDLENNVLDRAIHAETLERDLVESLAQAGYDLTMEQVRNIENATKTNASSRMHRLADYYDAETIELVADRERLIIGKYGYQDSPAAA